MRYVIQGKRDDRVVLFHSAIPGKRHPLGKDELMHYGVKGMSWGDRRYQNKDGSLTALGRRHYGVGQERIFGESSEPVSQASRIRARKVDARAARAARPASLTSNAGASSTTQTQKSVGQKTTGVNAASLYPSSSSPAKAPTLTDSVLFRRNYGKLPTPTSAPSSAAPAASSPTPPQPAAQQPAQDRRLFDINGMPLTSTAPAPATSSAAPAASNQTPPQPVESESNVQENEPAAQEDPQQDNRNIFQRIGDWAGNAWNDTKNWVGNAANDVGNWVGNAANDTANWVGNAANDVGNWVGNAVNDVGGAVNDVGQWIGDRAQNVGGFAQGLFTDQGPRFTPGSPNDIDPDVRAGQQAGANLNGMLARGVNGVGQWVGDRVNDVGGALNNAGQYVSGVWNGAVNNQRPGGPRTTRDPDTRAGMQAGQNLRGAVNDAGNWLGNAWNDTKNWVGNAANDVGNWVGNAANDTANWVGNAANDVGNWVGNAVNDVGGALNNAGQYIGGVWNGVTDPHASNRAWDSMLGNNGPNAVPLDPDVSNGMMAGAKIRGAVNNFGNWVGDTATNAWNWGRQAVNDTGDAIRNAGQYVGGVWNGLTSGQPVPGPRTVRDPDTRAGMQAGRGVRKTIDGVVDWTNQNVVQPVAGFVGRTGQAIGNTTQNAVNAVREFADPEGVARERASKNLSDIQSRAAAGDRHSQALLTHLQPYLRNPNRPIPPDVYKMVVDAGIAEALPNRVMHQSGT